MITFTHYSSSSSSASQFFLRKVRNNASVVLRQMAAFFLHFQALLGKLGQILLQWHKRQSIIIKTENILHGMLYAFAELSHSPRVSKGKKGHRSPILVKIQARKYSCGRQSTRTHGEPQKFSGLLCATRGTGDRTRRTMTPHQSV